jgi:aminopeptidase-like protein
MSSEVGEEMYQFAGELFPVCRSITGDGVRETLRRMQQEVPLEIVEIPSGSRVFDWEVPLEWNIDGAYIEDADGRRVVDFADNNLHIVSYSTPVDTTIALDDLSERLHIDPRNADWIPYRTSYYARNWGFCLSESARDSMVPGKYKVKVDSRLEQGSLTYGELLIPGKSKREILIYSHTCHPSLANDNLSGLAVTTWLAKILLGRSNRFSFRFVWGAGTIGSLTWLANNESRLENVKHALVCCLLGRPGALHYKRTPSGCCDIDELVESVLSKRVDEAVFLDFEPYGYDERQFCSPGIRLPAGRISRLPNDRYPEYHSSAYSMSLLQSATLEDSLNCLEAICDQLDANTYYVNKAPKGEPLLGKRGLYDAVGGMSPKDRQLMMLWLLNQSDGHHSIQRIARRVGINLGQQRLVADELEDAGLLIDADMGRRGSEK